MFNKNNLNGREPSEAPTGAFDNTSNNTGSDAGNILETNLSYAGVDNVNLSNYLATLFKCSVCYDYILPPIIQRSSGELVCLLCHMKFTCCLSCRASLTNIRKLAMEKETKILKLPSKIDYVEMHNCPCPGVSCEWQGPLYLVSQHLMASHITTTLQGHHIIFLATDVRTPGPAVWAMIQKCFGFDFMLVLEKNIRNGHEQFFAVVQLIGSRQQADNFDYSLGINGFYRHQLAWKATPLSIHESVDTAMCNSDCLVFDPSSAEHFIDDEGDLAINVIISLV